MQEDDPIADLVQKYSAAFDDLCNERHKAGQAEYGVFTFMGNDVIRMMMEEVADTANYCRMQFIKLMFLQHMLEQDPRLKKAQNEEGDITLGMQAFKGTGEHWKDKLT